MSPKSLKCLFLGYSRSKSGYHCYNPSLKKSFVTMDVTFFEDVPFYSSSHTTSCPHPAVTLPLLLPVTDLPQPNLHKFASPPIVYSRRPQLDIIILLKPQFLLIDMLLHPWCIAAGTLWIPSQLLTNPLLLIQVLDKTYLLLLSVACHMSLLLPTI